MDIIPLTKERYGEWDAFCEESKDAWFWHTTPWLAYTLHYKPERNSEPLSFFVSEGGKMCAVCPLVLETEGSRKEFTFGGEGLPTPACSGDLNQKSRERALRFICAYVDALAARYKASRIEFRFPVFDLFTRSVPAWNYLPKFGYIDTSIATRVVDVSVSEEELRRGLRHGHASDVALAEKLLTCEIFTSGAAAVSAWETYRDMHARAAGRQTRPLRTFEIQRELMEQGRAFLAGAKRDGVFVGFSYCIIYKQGVYYGSACNDPARHDLPIAHFLQWKSMLHAREQGVKWYEIGWQRYSPSLFGSWSEKELNISKFTRGFGGVTVPLFRGEKYYDAEYFLDVYEERLRTSAARIRQELAERT